MKFREEACFRLSRRLMAPPSSHHQDYASHAEWREKEAITQWKRYFSDDLIRGREVLDFGCGFGHLSSALTAVEPKRIVGLDLGDWIVRECEKKLSRTARPEVLSFLAGDVSRIPFAGETFDIVIAFDVVPHMMDPEHIIPEWWRVLRPGGRVLITWVPFLSAFGSNMSALIPIPWAHVIFGEKAMFRAAERICDQDEYVPRLWDFDKEGNRIPNKWRQWSSFREQGFINEVSVEHFREVVASAGFTIRRFEAHGFGGSAARQTIGSMLVKIPRLSEYMTTKLVIELTR